jgi:hypothetical protein
MKKALYLRQQVFPDGIFPATGKSEVEGVFPPPYFEWFQFNEVKIFLFLLIGR